MSTNDSEKIVPPKKSKAARKTEETKEDSSNHEGEDSGKIKESDADKNIFNEEPILEGKRKRNSPVSEQFAKDWLQKHLVESEISSFLLISDIHKCYVESCTANGGVSLVKGDFVKLLNSTFPKGYSLSPDCPYKDAVKKKKLHKTKTVVQTESLRMKMKDIITDAILSLGNPRRGVSMNSMKNFVSGKYPSLMLDQREGNFKKVVSNLFRFKKIECMRGIGACGFYRLPRTPEQEAEEIAKEKEEARDKLKKKKEKRDAIKKKAEDGLTEEDGSGDRVIEVAIDDLPNNKEAKEEVSGDAGGDASAETKEEGGEDKNARKKDKKTKKKKVRKASQSSKNDTEYLDLENPSRVEDTFPLAMTYNCEPKEASIVKIVKYVTDFYHQDLSNKDKLKKCLESGAEKGYWTQVTGTSSGSGTYRLTIEEFDPNADSDLTGMVMNAIVACTEPKTSSASLLKKYIQEYHPGLKVIEQPRKFKAALLRAVSSNKIKQLSGIGATGSFQLMESFRPSPSILQGKGSMGWPSLKKGSDEKEDVETEDSEVDDTGLELYRDAYKPRPSKRRGKGRNAESTKVSRLDLSLYPSFKRTRTTTISSNGSPSRSTRGKAVSNQKRGTKRPTPRYNDDEEVGEDEEIEEEEEEEEEESELEYEAKKTRGGRGVVAKAAKKSLRKSRPASKSSKASKPEKGGVTPKQKKAKLSKVTNASPPEKLEARTAKRRISYVEADVEDEDDDNEKDSSPMNMTGSPRRGTKEKKPSRNQPARNQKSVPSSVQEVSVVLDRELEAPTALKNPGKSGRLSKGGGAISNGSKPSTGKAKTKKGRRKSRGRY